MIFIGFISPSVVIVPNILEQKSGSRSTLEFGANKQNPVPVQNVQFEQDLVQVPLF